jgi:RNA recognition motif-containing protein
MDQKVIIILNLNPSIGKNKILKIFSSVGKILRINLYTNFNKQRICTIRYPDSNCSIKAINQFNGYRLEGRNMGVRFYDPNRSNPKSKNVQTKKTPTHDNTSNGEAKLNLNEDSNNNSYIVENQNPNLGKSNSTLLRIILKIFK